MRGRLGPEKWSVVETTPGDYLAERIIDGKYEAHELRAHCLACAKTDVLAKYSGRVDLRGHHRGLCGGFLWAMQQGVSEGQAAENEIGRWTQAIGAF